MIYNLKINNFGISQINNYVYRRLNDARTKRKTNISKSDNKDLIENSARNENKKK